MATWSQFAEAEPELEARGRERLAGHAYIATTGADGRPFVHPIVPLIGEGRLFVFVQLGTPKEHNLRRDGRYAMHTPLGEKDEEFIISGHALEADDAASRTIAHRAAEEIGMTTKDDVLMEFLIERAHWAVWEGLGTADARRITRSWKQG